MKKIISAKVAGNILLVFLGVLAIFHVLVLLQVVPSNIIWGGQIGDSWSNLLMLEITALLMIIVFSIIIAVKINYIMAGRLRKTTTVGVWFIFAFLILNTVGNLISGVTLEKLIFTPISLILALFALRLVVEK